MSRPTPGKLAFVGINMDKVPGEVAADWWTAGRNVMFVAGETVRVPGEQRFDTAVGAGIGNVCHYVDVGAQAYWAYAGNAGIWVTNGSTHWNITPTTGWGNILGKNRILTIGDLNGVLWVNHPERGPFWWNGVVSSPMVPLPDWPAGWSCQVMRGHKVFLMAMNIDTGAGLLEGQVSWSSSANPGQIPSKWHPAPDNDAGDMQFSTPGGPIIDGISVRDQFFVSKLNYTGVMQYVGGQFVFEGRDVFPSIGLFAAGCAVEHGNLVYMYTGDGALIRHDGNSISNLLYGVLEQTVRRAINYEYPSSCFMFRHDEAGQVGFAYPTGTEQACTEAVLVEVISQRPALRDMPWATHWGWGITGIVVNYWDSDTVPVPWNDDGQAWNEVASGYQPAKLIFNMPGGGLLEVGKANTTVNRFGVQGVPVNAYAERMGADFDDIDYRKTVTGLRPRIKSPVGGVFTWTIGGQDSDQGPVELLPPIPFVMGTDVDLDFFLDARLLSIRVATVGGGVWRLESMFPFVRKSGRW
jgi:hypothetical protein